MREVPLTVLGKRVKVLAIEQDSGVQGFEPQTSRLFKVEVINQLKQPTAIHWHGIVLPALMDGVPFVSQEPIPLSTFYISFSSGRKKIRIEKGISTWIEYHGLIDNPYNYEAELLGQELIRWRFVAMPSNSR